MADAGGAPFVLDLESNPHPRMLAGALERRRKARATRGWPGVSSEGDRGEWRGYLAAMADATGCEPDELEAWLDRHDPDACST